MNKHYVDAAERYAAFGIDTEKCLDRLSKIPVSIHCWQGDDIHGFENGAALSGGIAATGNFPGAARNPAELMADYDVAMNLIPGKKRINLHSIYAITDEKVDRDRLEPKHFEKWVEYAKKHDLGIDFNPTYFSHPMAQSNLTLSSPDEDTRRFWINHSKACRKIAAYFGEQLGTPSLHNIWIPDGYKNVPADRFAPRKRLKDSLDEIYSVKYNPEYIVDSVESKLFGLGLEAYTVGSSEFYISYAATHPGVYVLLDNGHYHPTESVSDKITSLLNFFDKVPLHVTRPLHWDSDHVVVLDDELKSIANEIICNNADKKVMIGLDYFDASVNRIAAWVIGTRNMQKALLLALLKPDTESMLQMQDEDDFTQLLMLQEEIKSLPFGAVWEEYCRRQNVPEGREWYETVKKYENDVLIKRR